MATVEDSIRLRDGYSSVLLTIRNNARSAEQVLNEFRATVETPVQTEMFQQMNRQVNTLETELREAQQQLNQLGEQGRRGMNGVSQGASMAIVNIAALIQILGQGYELFKKFTDTADSMTSITARVKLVNDGSQTDEQLDQMIFQSAQRARASYEDTAAAISKMGILAGEAFSGNDEMVYFAELMNKTFKVGGSSIMEQQSAMYQLTQAMAAGKLQGDEFRSIMENAPMLAQAIADVTGKTKGELKQMSADGVITSEIIKAAMFNAADDIESKFAQMPVTFGERMRVMKNDALQSLKPVMEEFSNWVNSREGEQFFNNLENVVVSFATAGMWAIDLLTSGANWVADHWSVVEPIMWGLTAAIGAATTAQWAMNIAAAFNPYTWIVLAIAAVVALGVAIYRNDAAFEWFSKRWNWILDDVDRVKIGFAIAGNFIANVFDTLKVAVLQKFQDMLNGAFTTVNELINAANKIPGVALPIFDVVTAGTDAAIQAEANRQRRAQEIEQAKLNAAMATTYRNYKLEQELKDREAKRNEKEEEKGNPFIDLLKGRDYTISNVDKVGSVGKIDDDVKISNDDMKIMRELAEVQAIQKFITYSPDIKIETGDLYEKADIDDIIDEMYRREEIEYEAVMAY